jgi:hypothetical protein
MQAQEALFLTLKKLGFDNKIEEINQEIVKAINNKKFDIKVKATQTDYDSDICKYYKSLGYTCFVSKPFDYNKGNDYYFYIKW